MIAAYLRVSSKSQDVATQRHAIERAAATRGQTVARWFADVLGGAKTIRPKLAALVTAARGGEISTLYVYRLDRLSRAGIRDTLTTLETLRAAGVEVRTIADGFDLNGPAAEVVVAVLAWAAQMERAAIGERIASARQRVEAAGKHWGRPRKLNDRRVAEIHQLAAEGRSLRQIAMAVKVPRSTVGHCLAKKGVYGKPKPPLKKALRKR
jgi:DNA invertase Pin-like site-specific DNA recombinase